MRTHWYGEGGDWYTTLRGRQIFGNPRLNKGTGFPPGEREALGLVGLMPYRVVTLEQQAARAYNQYSAEPDDLAKNVYLTALHDRNEVLYYRLVTDHLREMLPIVYTPTIGDAIERYSHMYRRPRGVYLSVDAPELIEPSLAATDLEPGDVDIIVATDAEAILGIGDWGVGGIAIAEGKLVVYCAAGGIDPNRAVPVILDVGTNRQELLDDPLYLGNAHPRVDRDTYDRFVDAYVSAATKLFPDALLHWEDFGPDNANRILDRYRDRLLTFNDDIQGTGAVNLAAVLSGVAASGVPLAEHRVVIFGAGSAGVGIARELRDAMVGRGLSEAEATVRSPRPWSGRWPSAASGRSSFRCRTRPACRRPTRPICSAGPAAERWWPPAAPSSRSPTTRSPTWSGRPTTPWSSPASASAWWWPGPAGSPTG